MSTENQPVLRRSLIGAAGLSAIGVFAVAGRAPGQSRGAAGGSADQTTMADVPLSSGTTLTVERRGQIVLIGLNRPLIQNRLDPDTRRRLAEAYHQYDNDPSLRAAILFGHGDNFSRGIDVDASQAGIILRRPTVDAPAATNPPGTANGHLSKPVIVVAHGDTWNLGHELYLAGDIRIAAANTGFGQDEASHARFPGGGGTVRFVREAGWGNAMRYMLTGDHWSAEESLRMGVTQEIAPTPEAALQAGLRMAAKIAGCGPLGIKATLASAHQVIDPIEADALSRLGAQYEVRLYRTQDFIEGRKAEAEGRAPVYQGK